MSYLLDTSVVSELRKPASRIAPSVSVWARHQVTSELFISVITVLEVEIGIARVARRDEKQGLVLRRWLERDVLTAFAGRILPIDVTVARLAAAMHVPDQRPQRDALIAATALAHAHIVVTRNTADFEVLGVELLKPCGA